MLASSVRGLTRAAGLQGRRRLAALAADDISSLKPHEVAIRMLASPVTATLQEGIGVVEAVGGLASNRFAKDDLAFSPQFAGGELKSVAKIDASLAFKLPNGVPAELGAFFARACTAYRLLVNCGVICDPQNKLSDHLPDYTKGDVVIHAGGESAVGHCLAQLAVSEVIPELSARAALCFAFQAARGVTLISLVSADVPSTDDAVELLKNIGATIAVPAKYVCDSAFRKVMSDIDAPRLVIMDMSRTDVLAVNSILSAAKVRFSTAKAALEDAHPFDKRDAKLVATLIETIAAPGAKLVTHDARPGDPILDGATPFSIDEWLKTASETDVKHTVTQVADAAASNELKVWVEAYTTDTLPRALELRDSGVYRHPYRQPVWVAELVERC